MSAAHFATQAHHGQKYGKGLPYTVHLQHVWAVLMRFGFKDDHALLDAGWLHDVLEDTKVTALELCVPFGQDVTDLVVAVTDKPGANRSERHSNTYPALRTAGARAVALKLADRIANVEFSIDSQDEGKIRMYWKEHAQFRDFLHLDDEHEAMWEYLGYILSRAFRNLPPKNKTRSKR